LGKKAIFGIALTLLLTGMLALAFNIQPVKADPEIIYIRADGSVDPSTAPIQRDEDIYTLTGNINGSIVVERDNITINGNGHLLQGTGSGYGIKLSGRRYVTIKNAKIKSFAGGIYLDSSSKNTISGNNITDSYYGIELHSDYAIAGSSNNIISRNNVTNNHDGIYLGTFSYNNIVSGNNVRANKVVGIVLSGPVGSPYYLTNNIVSGNNVTDNDGGISLSSTLNNTVRGNNVRNNWNGIYLLKSSNNAINGNNVTDSHDSITLDESSNNTISGNNVKASKWVGILLIYWSNNNILSGNDVTDNGDGVVLDSSSNNTISGNKIKGNDSGIGLFGSSNNTIRGNNVRSNGNGIRLAPELSYESFNNRISGNNFVNNTKQVDYSTSSVNTWDDGYPSGGNYWSDYTSVDLFSGPYQNETGSDGIGDTPYIIDANNQDRYPLMSPFNMFDAGTWNGVAYKVEVVSNSTISGFHFNPAEGAFIRFNVTGSNDTKGFSRVAIPKQLLWVEDGWVVLVDDEPVVPTVTEDANYTYLYFTYSHSTKTVQIIGTNVVPEFPSALIVPLAMILTMLAVIFAKKKSLKKDTLEY